MFSVVASAIYTDINPQVGSRFKVRIIERGVTTVKKRKKKKKLTEIVE